MQPRIYTYKVTFEEVPHWYWGVHKEKHFNDGYMGSPHTHRWMWDFYTPKLTILEIFSNTEEGWKEAQLVEKRIIRPDLNNPFCLNQHCGGRFSLEIHQKIGQANVEFQRGCFNPEFIARHNPELHQRLRETGKSFWNKEWQAEYLQKRKDEGSFFFDPEWQTQVKAAQREAGIGFFAVESKKKGAKKTNSTRWQDPDHPELGAHHFQRLIGLQRRNGFPCGRENRVKVEEQTAPNEA